VVRPDAKGLPYNQRGCFTSGFLPAVHQGAVINAAQPQPVPDLFAADKFTAAGRVGDAANLAFLDKLNRAHAAQHPGDSRLEARITSYELAAKMQLSAPEALELKREPDSIQKSYGLENPVTGDFGRRCLLARRLVERGVRFVQVWSGPQGATGNWDNHASIPAELPPMAASVDRPIAALRRDLNPAGWPKTRWSSEPPNSVGPRSRRRAVPHGPRSNGSRKDRITTLVRSRRRPS